MFDQPLSLDTSSVKTMSLMFNVRSIRDATTSCRVLHCMRLLFCLVLPARTPRLALCALLLYSWQRASAFNQPLNFDTSSVMDMKWMFGVRSSPCPAPSRALPYTLRASRSSAAPIAPDPYTSLRTTYTIYCVDSRQGASSFNQPLSFDTSSVTTMRSMFNVRSSREICAPDFY